LEEALEQLFQNLAPGDFLWPQSQSFGGGARVIVP
jgi:hypothetical protein